MVKSKKQAAATADKDGSAQESATAAVGATLSKVKKPAPSKKKRTKKPTEVAKVPIMTNKRRQQFARESSALSKFWRPGNIKALCYRSDNGFIVKKAEDGGMNTYDALRDCVIKELDPIVKKVLALMEYLGKKTITERELKNCAAERGYRLFGK